MVMMRRRGMMGLPSSAPVETWDFEWDYTDGLPENNGMAKTTSGTVYSSMQSNGLKINVSTSNAYVRYQFPTASVTQGIMEVVYIPNVNQQTTVNNLRLALSNGTNGAGVVTPTNKVAILDAEKIVDMTVIHTGVTQSVEHTLRAVLKGQTFDVYLDGSVIATDQSCSSVLYTTGNRVFVQGTQANAHYIILKSMRLKNSL